MSMGNIHFLVAGKRNLVYACTMTTTTVIIDVPQRFHDDHTGRDLPGGRLLKTLARTYRVELDQEEFEELLSDARHYAGDAMSEWVSEDFAFAMAVVQSARATVRKLESSDAPSEWKR